NRISTGDGQEIRDEPRRLYCIITLADRFGNCGSFDALNCNTAQSQGCCFDLASRTGYSARKSILCVVCSAATGHFSPYSRFLLLSLYGDSPYCRSVCMSARLRLPKSTPGTS